MFLVKRDFYRLLNSRDIAVLLEETELYSDEVLSESIEYAVELVKSKLQHRYDPDKVFFNVNTFSLATTYSPSDTATETPADLILYTEDDFNTESSYVSGDRVAYELQIYQANTSISPGAFNSTQWDLITNDNSYYYCIQESTGNLPTDTAYFTKGDNRNPLIRDYTIKLAIYELFIRVQPRVFPDWIITERENAIDHLTRISNGKDTVLLPVKLDSDGETEGNNFNYGYETQKNWNF